MTLTSPKAILVVAKQKPRRQVKPFSRMAPARRGVLREIQSTMLLRPPRARTNTGNPSLSLGGANSERGYNGTLHGTTLVWSEEAQQENKDRKAWGNDRMRKKRKRAARRARPLSSPPLAASHSPPPYFFSGTPSSRRYGHVPTSLQGESHTPFPISQRHITETKREIT